MTDNFQTGQSTTRYTLKSGKQETVVRPTELAAEPGDRVAVTGRMRDGRLVGAVEATSASTQAAVAAGPRKVAVLLVTFPGEPAAPWSPGESRSEVFTASNSVNAFFQEESYGGISLTGKLDADGDVFGWFRLDSPTAGCPDSAWKDAADAAAVAAGIDLTGYQHLIYSFPWQSSCSWLGRAALSGNWSMINGNLFGVRAQVTAHELGHNLGLLHAGSWTCTSGGIRVPISDTCTTSEYGDPFDAMGNIGRRHSNGWNLAKLGILAPENVETVDATGTYSMRSALHPTAESTVLRIPRTRALNGNVASWYYLEVREGGGVFENVADFSTTGVSIRATAAGASAETLLLDANPETSTFQDAPLGVGQILDGGPVRIRTVAAGGGIATVEIDVDTEPPSPPSDLQATVDANGVRLTWVGADNVGVKRYFVFRDGKQVGSNLQSPSFRELRPPAGEHEYTVVAEDESLNRSDPSEPLAVTVPIVSGPTCAAGRCKLAYRYSGAPATWTVPPGVDDAFLTVEGARGGGVDSGQVGGGSGALIWATLEPLTTGQVVDISVGGRGRFHSEGGAGGFNGGGDGGLGGGGGGYTKVELDSTLEVLAAGGGGRGMAEGLLVDPAGGSGSSQGGTGGNGFSFSTQGATLGGGKGGAGGGAGGTGGAGGQVSGSSACPAGTQAGLPGGGGGSLLGGGGVASAGGGGGGGNFGGGQGGGGATDGCDAPPPRSGGGGGGSSFVAPGRLVGFDSASGDDGWLSIEYDNPIFAAAHTYTTLGDQEIDVPAATGVLSNASAPGGVELTLSLVDPPRSGSLTLRDDGSFTYVPEEGYLGTDSFDYRVSDPTENYAEATVTLNVAGPPSATITSPPGDGTYVVGQVVPTTFSCAEGIGDPGLVSCADSTGVVAHSGGAGHLDTSSVGSHAYSVTATSSSGLTGEESIAYTVEPAPPKAFISSPLSGGTYALRQFVPTSFSCTEGEGGTGLSSCVDSIGAHTASGGSGHLDTSTVGVHTYTVSAVSKDGLMGSASITYTVVPDAPQDPPKGPEGPPDVPEDPTLRMNLSLGASGKSLRELLRTRKLVVVTSVNKAAKVALAGSARLKVRARGREATRFVPVFERKTLGFAGPGKKEVTLALSRKGLEVLRLLSELRLAITGKATDEAGDAATRTVALTLQR